MMTHFFASGAGRVGLVVLLAVGVGRPVVGQNFSATRTDYATDLVPLYVVVADVNGDGRPDLVTAHSGPSYLTAGSVGVRLAAGPAGGFAATRTDYPTQGVCLAVVVADVNGDGRPDLLTVQGRYGTRGGSVYVRLAAGPAGSFAATSTNYGSSISPIALAVTDVNADGRPDLVMLNSTAVVVYWMTGASGTFAPFGPPYPTGDNAIGGNSFGLAVADVNADGRPDLLTTNGMLGTVRVRLADVTVPRPFGATLIDYPTGSFPTAVVAADVNADGRPDLLTVSYGNHVGIRLADAAASGGFSATRTDYPVGNGGRMLVVADINADGRPDLVMVHESDNTVGTRLGAGPAGAFAATRIDYPTGRGPTDMAVADVNADGRPDLITVHSDGNTVGIRLNTGTLATGAALAAAAITLYPNPTGAVAAVHISLPAAPGTPATAALLDALGRVLRPAWALAVAGGQATGTLPTAGLPPGLYLLRLTSSAGTRCQRLIVE